MGKRVKYQQVVDWVLQQIDLGLLGVGDKLETEAQLSERFSYSRQTIRQALGELEKEGIISRVQGSGSYVKNASVRGSASPLSSAQRGSSALRISSSMSPQGAKHRSHQTPSIPFIMP